MLKFSTLTAHAHEAIAINYSSVVLQWEFVHWQQPMVSGDGKDQLRRTCKSKQGYWSFVAKHVI